LADLEAVKIGKCLKFVQNRRLNVKVWNIDLMMQHRENVHHLLMTKKEEVCKMLDFAIM
jgi:IS30 family transposase